MHTEVPFMLLSGKQAAHSLETDPESRMAKIWM